MTKVDFAAWHSGLNQKALASSEGVRVKKSRVGDVVEPQAEGGDEGESGHEALAVGGQLRRYHAAVRVADDGLAPSISQRSHQLFVEQDEVPKVIKLFQANRVTDARV